MIKLLQSLPQERTPMSLGICPERFKIVLTVALSFASLVSFADEPKPARPSGESEKIVPAAAAVTGDTSDDELTPLVADAITTTSRRFLTADVHTPWQILHGILALRQDFQIKVDGGKTSALTWLSEGNEWKGESIVVKTPHGGEFHQFTKPYHFQGHPNQFLAILTMSELGTDFEFLTAKGESVTIEQMLNNAKMTVNDREEITWTLWSLARYVPIDSEWINKDGKPWSMERLVQIQTYADVNQAACGGTHGLFALSLARNSYIYSGKRARGIWLEADQKIKRYIAEARSLQNPDGSFSSSYFSGPGKSDEFGKRIATSGHILEFLMVAVDDKQLKQPWLRNAVQAVAKDLTENKRKAADCGPLYHALHALVLYRQRVSSLSAGPESPDPESSGDAEAQKPVEEPAGETPVKKDEAGDQPAREKTEDAAEPATADPTTRTGNPVPKDAPSKVEPASSSESTTSPLFGGSRQPVDSTVPDDGFEKPLLPDAVDGQGPKAPAAPADNSARRDAAADEQSDPVLEENAVNSAGMSGEQTELDGPLPPTSD